MSKLIFPPGKRIFENKTYSREFLELTLSEIRTASEFTGFLKLDKEDVQDILFFLKGEPYAAGRVKGQRPFSCTIRDFFEDLPKGGRGGSFLFLHEIDPVLFKGMLIYFQKEPSIKASTMMLNFDDILREIQEGLSGALVILKKEDRMNFFFFLKGKPIMSHYARSGDATLDAVPVMEQLILYAYPKDLISVEAFIYLDITTSQAFDAEGICEAGLIGMPYKTAHEQPISLPSRIELSVVEGPDLDKKFIVTPPCTIGRKEGDIVLGDRMVSGRHAVMRESGGRLLIEDLGSTNGTYVNGVEIKVKELLEGEVITIGKTRLRVERIAFPEP